MSNRISKAVRDRSSTLSSVPSGLEEKKQRQARQYAISHRPHASHGFTRNRDDTHRLGSDLANFLVPRSAAQSAAPSRSASRHPSGEAQTSNAAEQASDRPGGNKAGSSPKMTVTWHDVRELRRTRQESEAHLRAGLESLSSMALTGSRQVDTTLHGIQSNMTTTLYELEALRDLTKSTNDTLSKFTREAVPAVTQEHEKQIASLQSTYDDVESRRIVELENRLKDAREKVKVLETRMSNVRNEIGEWEVKDAAELKRSRTRHRIFWSIVGTIFALLIFLLFPKQISQVAEDIAAMPTFGQTDFTDFVQGKQVTKVASDYRLRPPSRLQDQQDDKLRVFDEL